MELLPTIILTTLLSLITSQQAPLPGFRPPSVPLITVDPYMQVWSFNESLYDGETMYWNGWPRTMGGIIRVDGDVYRFMGDNSSVLGLDNTMQQMSVTVWPTRTIYQFLDPSGRVALSVQFTTPALPGQWDISSRPVTYITYNVSSFDGENHFVQLYYDNTAEIAVHSTTENVTWSRFDLSNIEPASNVMQMGTDAQTYFAHAGDEVGIDWGYAYVAVAQEVPMRTYIGSLYSSRNQFITNGNLPPNDDYNRPRPANDDWPVLAVAWAFTVDASTSVDKYITFAYDDIYSVEYFGNPFQPYWRRPAIGATIETLLMDAITEYPSLFKECEQFDTQLVGDLEAKGGAEYATLAALAYRQTTAATKLVWNDELQTPWVFFKEISSGGHVSRVDVIAAASPFFLYHDPEFLELSLLPILAYANNETGSPDHYYSDGWAPLFLGSYPVASIYNDEQRYLPMEETGNMLIMLAAITQKLGFESTNLWYPRYWPLLQSWADYLVSTLPDPPSQATSDEFETPAPHNANLAVKGIVGVGAFAELCRILGYSSDHEYYASQASSFVSQWLDLANDGDHFKRQYDIPGSWSMKYNLLFDQLLGLGLFPSDVVSTELSYYLTYQLFDYGIALDDERFSECKLDWNAFVAAMTPNTDQRDQIFETLYRWANTTTGMFPMLDWYSLQSGYGSVYMARPVVGAFYALMLV